MTLHQVCLRTRSEPWTDREAMYVAYIGKLFLQMLKCVIIPLIIPSLISAVGSLGKTMRMRGSDSEVDQVQNCLFW